MSELFQIEETLSPRLKWMRENQIETESDAFDAYTGEDRWIAYRYEDFGDNEFGDTEDEAIVALAKKLNVKLWNEL